MKILLILATILGLWFVPSWAQAAATITAASCNNTTATPHVQTAVNAAVDGDTVIVPGGTCTWSLNITIATAGKSAITLTGASARPTEAQCAVSGQNQHTCISSSVRALTWTVPATGLAHLTKMGISSTGTADSSCPAFQLGTVSIGGFSTNAPRISYMRFSTMTNGSCGSLAVRASPGLIDHTDFVSHSVTNHLLYTPWTTQTNATDKGDQSWSTNSTFGQAGNVFVEDSTFTSVPATVAAGGSYYTDNLYGARLVVRFSDIIDGSIQNHGTESGGRIRSHRHLEYYRNKGIWNGPNATPAFMASRGGTGRIFDNAGFTGSAGFGYSYVFGFNTFRRAFPPAGPEMAQNPFSMCGRHPATLSRATTLATGVIPNGEFSGIHPNKAYIDIVGAGAPFDGTGVEGDAETLAIASSSVGTPTTITTTLPHNYVTGQYVRISGHSGSVPSLNTASLDAYSIVTVTGASTFTIPVNVTTGGTGGASTNQERFTFPVLNSGALSSSGTLQATFDGNTDATGYPCIDQAGRGKGMLISGDGPGSTAISPRQWLNQALEPFYCWNNRNSAALSACNNGPGATVSIANRDFYNQNNSFNGTTQHGIGYGPRSSRPASCTPGTEGGGGDAWWATDDATNWNTSTTETHSADVGLSAGADGALDVCIATNTWADTTNTTCTGLPNSCYVPYTYPHPLNTVSAPDITPPAPPTGLTVTQLERK